MTNIDIQLDAWVIPDDHTVFKVSAGKTYRFYEAVREANMVFPDVRGFEELTGEPCEWSDQQLLKIIATDRWNRELISRSRNNQPKGAEGVGKADRTTLTFLKRLWFQAKKGDLVVVPAEGYDKQVLIGELLGDGGDVVSVDAKDGEYVGKFFGRRVRWLARPQKLGLSAGLLKALHSRAAVFQIGESVKEDVYRIAFGNFVYKDNYVSEFTTSKNHFTAEDHAVVATWINGLDALRYSIENGLGPRSDLSFEALGLAKIPPGFAAEVRIDIQSPGEIFVRTKTPFALTLMALFALASCGVDPSVDHTVTIHMKSVAGAATSAQSAVSADLKTLSIALGDRRPAEISLGKRAAEDARLSTKAVLKQAPTESK